MAKGTLKKQLKAQQEKEEARKDKKETKKEVKKQDKAVEKPAPVVAEKPKKVKKTKASDAYESEALSKKDKRKMKKMIEAALDAEAEEDDEDDDEIDFDKLAASESEDDLDSDSESESEEDEEAEEEEEEEEEEEDPEAQDVPLSDAEIDSDADVVPHTKLTINNGVALKESLARIELPWANHSFQEHQSIYSEAQVESEIKDIYDDTERELAFYKQALDAAKQGRKTLLKLKVPFSRPMDYFAEMVKSDEHMDKLKNKLLAEAADKKASEEAKKQRNLKKFGKQVQNATLQQRAKQKKETLDKIKSLKKRKGGDLTTDDDFQIALEEATTEEHENKRRKPNGKRLAKNAKFGSGGMKRFKRSNDKDSSADVSGFSNHKKAKRPGKSKRRH